MRGDLAPVPVLFPWCLAMTSILSLCAHQPLFAGLGKHTAWSRKIQLTDSCAFTPARTQKRKESVRSDFKIRIFWSQNPLSAVFRKSVWWKRLSRAMPVAQWNVTRRTEAKNVQQICTCDDGVGGLKPPLPETRTPHSIGQALLHACCTCNLWPAGSCTNPTFT